MSKDFSDKIYSNRLKLSVNKVLKYQNIATFDILRIFGLNLSLKKYVESLISLDILIQNFMKKTMVKTACENSHPFPRYTRFCRPTVSSIFEKKKFAPPPYTTAH